MAAQERQPSLIWEGEVDQSAVIYVRGTKLRVEDKAGSLAVQRPAFRFDEPLPDSRQDVQVKVVEGRGGAVIVAQPSLSNKYTLSVKVEDKQEGSGFYSLEFYWDAGPFKGRDPFSKKKLPAEGVIAPRGMSWTGPVDGTLRVVVEGGEAWSEPKGVGQAQMVRNLPAEENLAVALRKHSGRGKVKLIEGPSKRNGYRLVFEIADPGPGSDEYDVEAGW